MTWRTALAGVLADLARDGQTIGYGDLAVQLSVPGPGRIAQLAAALEATMAEDAAAGRPFRAALCTARASSLPALGFFQAAIALGRPMTAEAVAEDRLRLRAARLSKPGETD